LLPSNVNRGQALVETVVMLPILVTLILAISYLKALTDTQARAIEAARYVAWEGTWSVRENNDDLKVKDADELRKELVAIGLGDDFDTVEVVKRDIRTYKAAVEAVRPNPDDTQPTAFFPQALANVFGGVDPNQNESDQSSFSGAMGNLGSVANTIFDIGADVAIPVHDAFGTLSNWKDETDNSMYTATLTINFKGLGIFTYIPAVQVRGFSTVLSHPYNVKRDNDKNEYKAMFGAPDALFADSSAHVFKMWIFPDPGALAELPGPGFSGLSSVAGAISGGLDFVKQLISAPGGILSQIPKLGGDTSGLGWHTPDGTLKEFPELHDTSTDNNSGGSGSSINNTNTGAGGG
jgi:hypothetical protein